ncbi:ROK family transcriptional regulator [Nocardioides panzhihuensis]|uniref:Putative NBD/HSP70 family sugar kinase n=1 Tax=Nocardioides panzhihuensis TaxID=860243 RepID=A0A7Z0DM61_9ACTN|nr:ROK family transcriptional regulator [Nocardioides panzhihuensis]NYI77791.1 putative NBD/HSP70 family sugar kinase [Nocardioides panzhihuensis]
MTVRTEPAQHAGMRASNLALVLGEVARTSPVSRAQVAARTGLTKSSVSGLVSDLIDAGLIQESAPAATERGRPATALDLAPGGIAGLGLEINVDYLAAMVTDLTGVPRYHHVLRRDNRGREVDEVIADLIDLARTAARSAASQRLPLSGACVAVPGLTVEGAVVRTPNLGWARVDLADAVGEGAGLDVELENEANLAALGEMWFGGHDHDGAPLRDFVHVSGEIGIGGGIVIGGEVFRGAHAGAGELGHVVVAPDGPRCGCGGHGCLERMAGQQEILARAQMATMADLTRACEAGDQAALDAVAGAGRHLGVALASVITLLDPTAIVLGGAFATLAPWLTGATSASIGHHTGAVEPPRLLVSGLGSDAAVRGAAGTVVRGVIADPAAHLARQAAQRP